MNERIQELADKAIEDMPGAWNIPDEFCKKFAELIVRECANICFSEAQGHSMAFGEHCGIVIKEHFRVEE